MQATDSPATSASSASNSPGAVQTPTDTPDRAEAPAAVGIVPGIDVLGVRIGMPITEATAVLKAKGITMHPINEGVDYLGQDQNTGIDVTKATPTQLVRLVSHAEPKRMFEGTVISALRTKYGANGVDVGSAPTKEFARAPTRESCLKGLDAKEGDCKASLAARKDSNPQHQQACVDEREKACKAYPPAAQQPLAGGHAINWYYDERGRSLSQDGFERYCPKTSPAPDCKAIIVVAQFGEPDAAGTVPGFNVQLRSDWLLKRDNDEQHRQQVEAEKAAEKKRHDAEVNAARKNQPQL
jgi:hypothetical protein